MNLHVNLLNDEETRHPGSHLLRTFLRTFAIVGLAAVALHAAYVRLTLENIRGSLNNAASVWEQLEPEYREYQERTTHLATLQRLDDELHAFSNAQLKASVRLAALPETVPSRVQLTELSWGHSDTRLEDEPARRHDLVLTGLIRGEQADRVVQQFIASLQAVPSPADFGRVTPGGFKLVPTPRGAVREEKSIFEVRAEFPPRRYR